MTSRLEIQLFGSEVKRLRKLRGLTLPELARLSKISKGGLSKIENGNGNPTLDTIARLAFALKCQTKFLFMEYQR